MRANELWLRCQKARIMSWLNSSRIGATLPLDEGQYVIVAIYENGRYYKPDTVEIPNSVPADWIGPDGPIDLTPTTEEDPEEETPDGTE